MVCVASKQDPSDRLDGDQLGVFAKAILESVDVKSGALTDNPSIAQFKDILINRVDEWRSRTSRQKADVYTPLNVIEKLTRIFDRQPRAVESLAGK